MTILFSVKFPSLAIAPPKPLNIAGPTPLPPLNVIPLMVTTGVAKIAKILLALFPLTVKRFAPGPVIVTLELTLSAKTISPPVSMIV